MRIVATLIVAGAMTPSTVVWADEGMWTYDALPKKALESKWGFKPPSAWAEHLMHASLRIAGGCSASFVSPNGLLMSNQHCARECAQALSAQGSDLVESGFYAASPKEERRCPDMEVDQLLSITPETQPVLAATKGLEGAAFAAAERRAREKIESSCGKRPELRCEVVSLFHGGKYDLYTYRRYTDVRLAFIVEEKAATFGDPSRADWPYHVLDLSFLRVYDGGRPVDTSPAFLHPAKSAVKSGDLVFIGGNPGATARLATVAQLEARRDVELPSAMQDLAEVHGMAAEAARQNVEFARQFQPVVLASEGQEDRARKQHDALSVGPILDAQRRSEADLRAKVAADRALQSEFGRAWDDAARAAAHEREIAATHRALVIVGEQFLMAPLWHDAMALAVHAEESAKPDAQRLPEMQEASWPRTRAAILSSAPIDRAVEERMIAWRLSRLEAHTGTSHPLYDRLIGDEGEDALAARLVAGTRLFDLGERRRLVEGGAVAIRASDDPLLAYVRDKWAPAALAVRKDWDDNVAGVYTRSAMMIDQARLATGGGGVAPDATFSPRVAFGAVSGYLWYGADMPVQTTLGEAFALDRLTGPNQLPNSWRAAKPRLNMDVPLDFVADVDAVGGNSGSPVINRSGELVGLCFAANDAGEHNTFGNDPQTARAISATWTVVELMLRSVYGAGRLADEITRSF